MFVNTQNIRICAFLIAGTILFFNSIYASEGLRFGHTTIDPSLGCAIEANDNIYLTDVEEEEDWIQFFQPAVELNYKRSLDNYLLLGYTGEFAFYQENPCNDYQSHISYLNFSYRSPKGIYLKASEEYLETSDPYGAENQFQAGVPQVDRWTNEVQAVLGYEAGKYFSVETHFSNFVRNYEDEIYQWQDQTENTYGITGCYNHSMKSALIIQYLKTVITYDEQNSGVFDPKRQNVWNSGTSQDNVQHHYLLGIRFAPGGKIIGQAKFGYGTQNFENERDPQRNNYNSHETIVVESDLKYAFQEETIFRLHLHRKFTGSPDDDANTYIDNRVYLGVDHRLNRRMKADLFFGWCVNDYVNEFADLPDKYFDIYIIRTSWGYKLNEYIDLIANYRFKTKKSSNPFYESSEYTQNSISIVFSIRY